MAKDRMPKPKAIRKPSAEEAKRIGEAVERVRADTRRPLPSIEATIEDRTLVMRGPHDDVEGWSARLMDTLGTTDPRVVEMLMQSAEPSFKGVTDEASAKAFGAATEQALAFVADIGPQNPIESALALQMFAAHKACMTLANHAARADMRDALGDYNRMMNQTMRTFTGQMEAFHKLRTGGKQQVEVRYVYVDARTQTVVNGPGGAGGVLGSPGQGHAPRALSHAPAQGLPMWGADAVGVAVPVACDPGQEALSDARGQ